MLFEEKERTRTEPKRPGEDDYSFYDSSARPEYRVYRDLLNGWIAEMPEANQKEAISRFRKNESLIYQATLAELTVHAALKRQGYGVDVHPSGGRESRKPDFLASSNNGKPAAFVEVTTFGPAPEFVAQSKRDADIYNGLDKTRLPQGCRIGLDIIKHGAGTPSLRKLRQSIEKWAAKVGNIDPGSPPSRVFEIDDWKIEIILFGGFRKDVLTSHAIATAMGDARVVSAETEIRQALSTKGNRYGALDTPYLIVVADCKDELVGGVHNGDALLDAAFGTVATQVTTFENGNHEIAERRRADGYWGFPATARHHNVSGALLLPKPHLWDLRSDRWQPLLLRNPWADHPLPNDFLPLPGFSFNEEGEFSPTPGRAFADILGLPPIWPPEEACR
jgi:hypothetical protein